VDVCSVTSLLCRTIPQWFSLDDRALAATFYAYNRLPHVPSTSIPIGRLLATDTDFAAADRKCRPLPIVVDKALSTEARVGAATFQPRRDNDLRADMVRLAPTFGGAPSLDRVG
jgi:hypothetical protein